MSPDRRDRSRGILVALVTVAMLTACVGRPAENATGEEIYLQVCVNCHGENLEGGVGPALGPSSHSAGEPDEYIRLTVAQGRGRMPSFAQTLSDEQLERLIGFLRQVQEG